MTALGGVILWAITLLAVAPADATPLYTADPAADAADVCATVDRLGYVSGAEPVGHARIAAHGPGSAPIAAAPEPSGLAALAIVMMALGVSAVMRVAREVGALLSHCARYRIELGALLRWCAAHRRHAG